MSIRRICVPVFLFLTPIAILLAPAASPSHSHLFGQDGSPLSQAQMEARDSLNQGVAAFKNGQYEEAHRLFQRVKQLDPRLVNARLYLATAYASQYIPGAPSEENLQMGRSAIEEYKGLLDIDPQNLSAIDGLGSILFQTAGTPFDPDLLLESKSYHQKHMHIRPQDSEPYYWIGVIDWTLSFRANGQFRARYNLSVRGKQVGGADPMPPELRAEYAREYEPTIEEGIESLKKAFALRPDYDDAMVYLNLSYRRKADIAPTTEQREELTKMADDLLGTIKEIKEKRAEGGPQQH